MDVFLIGIFAFSTLGAALLVSVRLVGSFGKGFDDDITGRKSVDQEGDFLFIFFPMLKMLANVGFFKAIERLQSMADRGLADLILAFKRTKDEYKRAFLEAVQVRLAKHLFNHPSTREHKATSSFFLKDIAEHKRKIVSQNEKSEG
jgi:hypothetical protein